MPIKDRDNVPRLPRLGKVRLGIKVDGAKGQYPKAVDYFVVKEDKSTPSTMVAAFRAVYPEPEPRELDIMFPTDDPIQWADTNYKMYSASGLVCGGDGETAHARWDTEKNTWATGQTEGWIRKQIPCPGKACPQNVKGACKAVMNLQFMLYRVRGLGIWQIDTGSFWSQRSVEQNLAAIMAVAGGFRNLPLRLGIRTMEVTPEGGKKKKVHVLNLTQYDVMASEASRMVEAGKGRGLLLPAPDLDNEEPPDDLFPMAADGIDADRETGEVIEVEAADVSPPAATETREKIDAEQAKKSEPAPVRKAITGVKYEADGTVTDVTSLGALLNQVQAEFGLNRQAVVELVGSETWEGILASHAWMDVYTEVRDRRKGQANESD